MGRNGTLAWAFYDFANSAYGSLVPVLLFPLYYKSVILGNSASTDLWWGIAAGASILLSGLLAPLVGAIADATQRRRAVFITLSIGAVIGTALLTLSGRLTPLWATALFIATNMLYNLGNVLYDSLLAHVSTKDDVGAVSGLGWGLGYAGAIICTLLVFPIVRQGTDAQSYPLVFAIVAAFFLLFSLPAFALVRERRDGRRHGLGQSIRSSLGTVVSTLRGWREHRRLMLFLLAFYFFTEGIATAFFFLGLYMATTLGISAADIALLTVLNMAIAFPVTILVARHSKRLGYKSIIISSAAIWCVVIIILGMAKTLNAVIAAAVLAGFAIGTGQAAARAWYSTMVPERKRSQLFGFNALASKISATLGPVLFGVISVAAGNQRIAVFSILAYFIISTLIFLRVPSRSAAPAQRRRVQQV